MAFETQEIASYDDLSKGPRPDVAVLPPKLEASQLRSALASVLNEFQLQPKDKAGLHYGICLQYGDPSDRFFDVLDSYRLEQRRLRIDGFKNNCLNEVGETFAFVLKQLAGWPLTRGRLLMTRPGFKMKPHRDELGGRIHIPIITNSDCLFYVDDRAYHLPANGRAYWVNTHKSHYVTNNSDRDRYHLVFTLDELSYSDLSYEEIEDQRRRKMNEFFASIGEAL